MCLKFDKCLKDHNILAHGSKEAWVKPNKTVVHPNKPFVATAPPVLPDLATVTDTDRLEEYQVLLEHHRNHLTEQVIALNAQVTRVQALQAQVTTRHRALIAHTEETHV